MSGGPVLAPATMNPLALVTNETTTLGSSILTVESYDGPVTQLKAQRDLLFQGWPTNALVSVVLNHSNGTGTLQANYERSLAPGLVAPEDEPFQELYAEDLMEDVVCAPYWAAHGLTDTDIVKVRKVFDGQVVTGDAKHALLTAGWGTYHFSLLAHLRQGQESFINTVYEFRETFRVGNARELKKDCANPNTVQPLPKIGRTLTSLIATLPTGEWLKKPVCVTSAGKGYWTVQTSYHLKPKWSVIYGGTFTGL